MWIAQGFIQPQQERENLLMEDIGEEYFNFLLSRSLFQDVTRDENEGIVTFKMHDLMHDIACAISSHQRMKLNPNNFSEKTARKLRTLNFNDKDIDYKVLDDLARLRVLKLNRHLANDLRILLDKLIHLRYLDISGCYGKKFPKKFDLSLLYNLQTLKLGYITIDLPKNLKKLVNLRHLEFNQDFDMEQMPSYMGNLIHLQTLSKFVVGLDKGCKIEELGPLKNLKGTLTLTNLRGVQNKDEAMAAKLAEKKNLRHLTFTWNFIYRGKDYDGDDNVQVLEGLQPHRNLQSLDIRDFQGKVLPISIFVENLVEIRLWGCRRCEVLPMLGELANLKILEIYDMDSVRSIGNEFYGIDSNNHRNSFAFPKLKKLDIERMEKLEQWDEATVIASDLFGCLKILSIQDCPQLKKLPSGLEGCHSIEYLKIDECDNLIGLNVQNMHNLYHLEIDGLKRLPEGLGELSKLKELKIRGSMKNYEFSSIIHLSSQLDELELIENERGARIQLPQQLQHFTNLKILKISYFDGIEALPEWLGDLTCLRRLYFPKCLNLKELPSREALLRLTKLTDLFGFGCPKLRSNEEQERAKLSGLPIRLHVY